MSEDLRTTFLRAALWHGTLEHANELLASHPELAGSDLHIAAVLGDDDAVRRFVMQDPASVHATAPPFSGTPLNYLGLSKYLRLDRSRSDAFVRAATVLLDTGADPNAGFWTTGTFPERETALYGAAGVAHHGPVTRLLLERGADPNDEEVAYHSPEDWDLEAMPLVVETGRVTPENLACMLIRKHDWHHLEGVRYLLDRGADPNFTWKGNFSAVHHAVARDNDIEIVELLLDHGGDFTRVQPNLGMTGAAHAARRGRSDILEALEARGIQLSLDGVDRLVAACARRQSETILAIVEQEPELVDRLVELGGRLIADFAGNDNAGGVRHLVNLGLPVDARSEDGDGYWGIAANSTALHVASWRLCHDTARLLLELGADPNAMDAQGRTPLMLAVKGCVNSYWTRWKAPDTVEALLAAGASTDGVTLPTGYDVADELIAAARR